MFFFADFLRPTGARRILSLLVVLLSVGVSVFTLALEISSGPGIQPSFPAGLAMRGFEEVAPGGQKYSLLGTGYCRGGPPGGKIAISMVSMIEWKQGESVPTSGVCMDICANLTRCAGVELRNSDQWCELQVPTLAAISGPVGWAWGEGPDADMENALTLKKPQGTWTVKVVSGSPFGLTTVKPKAGFYCWRKVVECGILTDVECLGAGRYGCSEGPFENMCGPCAPLHLREGSDPSQPGLPEAPCSFDEQIKLPTLKISLGSPWLGGRKHQEALYLSMIYGLVKAWKDGVGDELIPIPKHKRVNFPLNITGHTSEWEFTLSGVEASAMGTSFDTRIENHPMTGLRAMSSLETDRVSNHFRLMEDAGEDRTRPHCIIGSTPDGTMSGLLAHTNVDVPLSHAATFYETPVLGWSFQDKLLADKTTHSYYMRVNRVALDYHLAVVALIGRYNYTRVGVVTSGTNRRFVRNLQEIVGSAVELVVADMSLETECDDEFFDHRCHMSLVTSMETLREQDVRIIVQEQNGLTQLESYWPIFSGLLRQDTLLIQVGVVGDCRIPLIPPTTGAYGQEVLWVSIRKSSNMNNRGEWNKMPGECRVCPNWAFFDLPASALTDKLAVAEYNVKRIETIYSWGQFCPEADTVEKIEQCEWCDHTADFWITPGCSPELEMMRQQMTGSLCVGATRADDDAMIERWTNYLSGLTADELIDAGAPQSFFDIFEKDHPLFLSTGVTLESLWDEQTGPWRSKVRLNAALLDALLTVLVAFNTWVSSAGESSDSLAATALRDGFRTSQNTAITLWMDTLSQTSFSGLTGQVEFESKERKVDYTIYSAQGENLNFVAVGSLSDGDLYLGRVEFPGNSTQPPLDREPACPPGSYYTKSARACSPCPPGHYCPGDYDLEQRTGAVICDLGSASTGHGSTACNPCPAGAISSSNMTVCQTCGEGQYTAEPGMGQCIVCPPGRFWQLQEPDEPNDLIGDNQTLAVCTLCQIGRFQDHAGSTICRDCGLKRSTQTEGASSEDYCLCALGNYLPLEHAQCTECPRGMECNIGSAMGNYNGTQTGEIGTFPMLLPRFWSSEEDPLSVYQCLDDVTCPGGVPGTCRKDSVGIVCAMCADGYYRHGDSCVQCNVLESSMVLFPVLPLLVALPVVVGLYVLSAKTAEHWSKPRAGLIVCGTVMLVHLQIQGLLWTLNLYFPHSLSMTWSFVAQINEGLYILRPQCAGFTTFEAKYYITVLFPVFIVACFFLVFVLSRAANHFFQDYQLGPTAAAVLLHVMDLDFLLGTFGALIETFAVAIHHVSFTLFYCYKHPNGKESLRFAPEVFCDSWQRQELLFVTFCSILLYVVGGFSLVIRALCVAPTNFRNDGFQKRWKFLLAKFRPDVHWWSAVILGRTLLLTLTTIMFASGWHQLLWVIGLMGFYSFICSRTKPWRHDLAAIFDEWMSYLMVAGSAALFRFSANPQREYEHDEVEDVVSKFIFVTSFLPHVLAVIFGAQVISEHLLPSRNHRKQVEIATELEQIGFVFATARVESVLTLSQALSVLSEPEKRELRYAIRILLAEDQLRVFSLRSSLGLSPSVCLEMHSRPSSELNRNIESVTASEDSKLVFDDELFGSCAKQVPDVVETVELDSDGDFDVEPVPVLHCERKGSLLGVSTFSPKMNG